MYLFLIVITNPYEGLDYDRINVYNLNYCQGDLCPSSDYYENSDTPAYYWDEYPDYEYSDYGYGEENYTPLFFDLDYNDYYE